MEVGCRRVFWDFAGSTIVHSVGGWAALAGAIWLGPRLNRFEYIDDEAKYKTLNFEQRTFPRRFIFRKRCPFFGRLKQPQYFRIRSDLYQPNSLSLSTLGCLILWLGWFGFNAGSTLEGGC